MVTRLTRTERYIATFLLSAAGDALGYRNGRWEFTTNGAHIHNELNSLGGLDCINLSALITTKQTWDVEQIRKELAHRYKLSMQDMSERAPGTTSSMAHYFDVNDRESYTLPFNERGGGCGAAMRAMCIGLRYWKPELIGYLIAVSVESGRLTHHHPTAYLGSYVSALFTAYALQGKPVKEWGASMVASLPTVLKYIEDSKRDVEANKNAWSRFESQWQNYLKLRHITTGETEPVFPEQYNVKERDEFYESISLQGWGGASGDDSTIIAYDALLGCQGSWEEFCLRGVLHGGDNDSTGAIGGAWFGAVYGLKKTFKCHYQFLEYKTRLADLAVQLYMLSNPGDPVETESIELDATLVTH